MGGRCGCYCGGSRNPSTRGRYRGKHIICVQLLFKVLILVVRPVIDRFVGDIPLIGIRIAFVGELDATEFVLPTFRRVVYLLIVAIVITIIAMDSGVLDVYTKAGTSLEVFLANCTPVMAGRYDEMLRGDVSIRRWQ